MNSYIYPLAIKVKLKQNNYILDIYMRNVKPIISYYKFWKWKAEYPQNIIFIAGLPRSGSTWIANMFSDLKGFEKYDLDNWKTGLMKSWDDFRTTDVFPGCFEKYLHKLAIIKGHTWGVERNLKVLRDSNLKYLITMRDPRDNLISCYYYIKNHSKHWDHVKTMDLSLGEYITFKLESGEYDKQNLNWIRSWLDNYDEDQAYMIKYEDMLMNPKKYFNSALSFLNIHLQNENISRIIEKNSFKNITGRTRGQEDKTSFNRKATSGEWETVFSSRQKQLFAKLGEDIISRLSYKPTL